MKYLITANQVDNHLMYVGAKSKGLFFLLRQGFSVPDFVVLPSTKIQEILLSKPSTILIDEVLEFLRCDKYIVRSNMMGEDGDTFSHAGQFSTKSNLFIKDVPRAIYDVLDHALREKKWPEDQCSVIIQEYIEPDISGVLFTRDPAGGICFLIEYIHGPGELLVSGNQTPEKVYGEWGKKDSLKLEGWEEVKKDLTLVETKLNHPQDIEWCIKDNKWFVLQTRNITTISADQYQALLSLEKMLGNKKGYRFIKSDVTDALGEAFPIMGSIVEKIYASGGPVQSTYKKYGISASCKEHAVVVFGKEFFVDAEKELQSILPAFSLLNQKRKPRWSRIKGSAVTSRNIIGLALLRGDVTKDTENCLTYLEYPVPQSSIHEWLEAFLSAYQAIFNVNLIHGIELKRFQSLVSSAEQDPHTVLRTIGSLPEELRDTFPPSNLLGNSLSIADDSVFYTNDSIGESCALDASDWYDSLPAWRRQYIKKKADELLAYERLREIGRWITIKYMSALRVLLKNLANQEGIVDYHDLFCLTIDQLHQSGSTLKTEVGIEVKRYKEKKTLPPVIEIDSLGHPLRGHVGSVGISPGKASGVLLKKENIKLLHEKSIILLTETLSPELSSYLDKVVGIYSKRGGVLSHLAIIAREKGIPVVVDTRDGFVMEGDGVKIDGSTGEVEKL